MPNEHYVEERNLSIAWGRGLRLAGARGNSEVVPLVVAITGFDKNGNVEEESQVRSALENVLAEGGSSVLRRSQTRFFHALFGIQRRRVRCCSSVIWTSSQKSARLRARTFAAPILKE